jgi:hypothetical protein
MIEYTLDWIGGVCPVQAEGTFQGTKFYFRARGNSWTVYIGNPDPFTVDAWTYGEPYGDEPFEAGWMSEEQALTFIEQALTRYSNEKAH